MTGSTTGVTARIGDTAGCIALGLEAGTGTTELVEEGVGTVTLLTTTGPVGVDPLGSGVLFLIIRGRGDGDGAGRSTLTGPREVAFATRFIFVA